MSKHEIPIWMTSEERYVPPTDKDRFIDKSIRATLRILSQIRSGNRRDSLLGIGATVQLVSTLTLVILVAVSRDMSFVLIVGVYTLLLLGLLRGETIISILRVSLIVSLFSLLALAPSAFLGNKYSIVVITVKICTSVTLLGIFSHSSPWHEVTASMRRFYVPDIFIFVLDITLKYIFLLGEFALNMLYSLKARSIGRNRDKRVALSGIAGTMFIRSVEMSQEMHAAMECRGFSGIYKRTRKIQIS
ncbi:MAG TPA: energy-coupling factor transporter transmembrane component T, partial [Spirochaetota bacterium]